jgi:hypothetical protein
MRRTILAWRSIVGQIGAQQCGQEKATRGSNGTDHNNRRRESMRWVMTAALATLCLGGAPALLSAAEPIATTDGEKPGTSLNVQELKVSNGTVMLKFTLINDGSQPFDPDWLTDSLDGHLHDAHAIGGVYLIDAANKKKYLTVYDTDNHCICSRGTQNIAPQSSANLWAKFPAPPDSVAKIGVVVPHFVPLDDVPLSR